MNTTAVHSTEEWTSVAFSLPHSTAGDFVGARTSKQSNGVQKSVGEGILSCLICIAQGQPSPLCVPLSMQYFIQHVSQSSFLGPQRCYMWTSDSGGSFMQK